MTELREALDALAREREPLGDRAAAPEELWGRGVRRKRARTAVTALVAVLVLAVGAGVGSWLPGALPRGIAPAASHGELRVPRTVATPSPWASGTAEAGPPGRLAVVWSAPRHTSWSHVEEAPFGISAATGGYRFLDLPHLAGLDQLALSPDGRYLAYWTTGTVGGSPLPPAATVTRMRVVTGVAVYDTTTGRVVRDAVSSRHGIDPQGLQWVGDNALVLSYGFRVTRSASDRIHTFAWHPGDGDPRQLRGDPLPFFGTATDARGGLVVPSGGGVQQYADLTAVEARQGRRIALPPKHYAQVTLRGDRVVAVQDGSAPSTVDGRSWLVAGTVGTDGRAHLAPVHRALVTRLLGWERSGRLVVQGVGRSAQQWPLLELDPGSLTLHRVGSIRPGSSWSTQPVFATGVVARGTAARPGPSHVTDPRLAVGLGVGAALLLVAGGLVRRRRARG